MIYDAIAGLISGMLGAMGFGGGGVLILYLTLYKYIPQTKAQGINLIFFIPAAILALILHTKNKLIDWKLVIRFSFLGLIGVASGYFLINTLPETIISKLFSTILIVFGIRELFSKDK